MPVRAPSRRSSLRPGLWAILVAATVAGCGDPCERLAADLCKGSDADYCARLAGWLETRLVDPQTKEPLDRAARDQMCSGIHKNVEMFYGYQFKAKQKLLGEPDFILASQKKAQEEARAYEEAMQQIKNKGDDDEPGGANMSD